MEEPEVSRLVISRKYKEAVFIGRDIKVTVLQVQGDKVRLAIEAPAEVPVWREELMKKAKGRQG